MLVTPNTSAPQTGTTTSTPSTTTPIVKPTTVPPVYAETPSTKASVATLPTPTTPSDIAIENANYIMKALQERGGFTPNQAAGIMSNLHTESAGTYAPNLIQYSDNDNITSAPTPIIGRGYGIAQWTYPSRQRNLISFAESRGTMVADLDTQIDFILKETNDSRVSNAIKMTTTAREASTIFLLKFEGPAEKVENKRIRGNVAEEYAAQYAADGKIIPEPPIIPKGSLPPLGETVDTTVQKAVNVARIMVKPTSENILEGAGDSLSQAQRTELAAQISLKTAKGPGGSINIDVNSASHPVSDEALVFEAKRTGVNVTELPLKVDGAVVTAKDLAGPPVFTQAGGAVIDGNIKGMPSKVNYDGETGKISGISTQASKSETTAQLTDNIITITEGAPKGMIEVVYGGTSGGVGGGTYEPPVSSVWASADNTTMHPINEQGNATFVDYSNPI